MTKEEKMQAKSSRKYSSHGIEWPLFGVRTTKNPYFKIEGEAHNAYVDMPNWIITEFLNRLDLLSKLAKDPEWLYAESLKLKNSFNEFLRKEVGNWLSISIRREPFGKRPFGVQVRINWELFQKFLEEFAKREDIPLEHKYEYLFKCRVEIAWMRKGPSEELMERKVKKISESTIEEINSILDSFIELLSEKRTTYRKKLLLKRRVPLLTLACLPEMILTFKLMRECVSRGTLSTCYREMRKVLESLSWVVTDDLLLFRKRNEDFKEFNFIPPLRIPSKEWYQWARSKGLIIKSISEFLKPLRLIREKVSVSRKAIENAFCRNVRYPLFLSFAKTDKLPPNDLKRIPSYESESLSIFVKENLREVMRELTGTPSSSLDELTRLLIGDRQFFAIRYPSNSFIIQLLGKMSNLKLSALYERYSYFVHSYDKTWQLYPFSSVLEFKIFKNELIRFTKLIKEVLNFLEKELLLRRA